MSGALVLLFTAAVCLAIGAAVTGWVSAARARGRQRDSERLLERHQELSLDLICTSSFDGYFVQLSPSWETVLGLGVDEILSRPYLDFIHPDDVQATIDEVEMQASTGQLVFNFQNRYRHADGSYRWLEWTSRPDADTGLMFAVARDVTERKEAEEIVARHRQLLEEQVTERTSDLEQARWETLRCLALAAEFRDDQTYAHTQRVGRTAAHLAERLGCGADWVALIRHAAPLHDVGKVGVPDSVLLKPGPLSDAEMEVVRRHAEAGARILEGSNSEILKLAQEIALSHHEWWDGTGYPRNLVGEQIPLSGRIVALADVYDALTHDRPYKPAWPVVDSVREIHRLSGVQFDPHVVEAFNQLNPDQLAGRADDTTRTGRLRAVS